VAAAKGTPDATANTETEFASPHAAEWKEAAMANKATLTVTASAIVTAAATVVVTSTAVATIHWATAVASDKARSYTRRLWKRRPTSAAHA